MPTESATDTIVQYEAVILACRELFRKKTADYGTAWRVLRPVSIIDQIFIKAQRIRTIQEKGTQKIGDDIPSEFVGIINYAVIGLIQGGLTEEDEDDIPLEHALHLYDRQIGTARDLMQQKNHDYGEAWRQMSQESFTDLILMKLLRVRQILQNKGKTLVSEGIDANYLDMINYAVFALILVDEQKNRS